MTTEANTQPTIEIDEEALANMTPERHFRCLIRARNTLLWVTTDEERRAEKAIGTVAHSIGYSVRYWDCATGATGLEVDEKTGKPVAIELPKPAGHPRSVFQRIKERKEKEVWVLRDLPPWLREPAIERGLKSLAREVQEETNKSRLAAVVVLTSDPNIPAGLRGCATSIDWPLPSRGELNVILDDILEQSGKTINGERDSVIDAAAGLTATDAESAIAYSIVTRKRVDPSAVSTMKKQIIDREKVLTWYEPDKRGLDAIGGLEPLKEWLEERRLALSPEAREYGLPTPKGVLLAGIPGCGKSLTAKAMPTAWGIPLLRMDIGALRSKFVGESEANLRKALKVAEAVSPVVLWLDEIEKGLGSSSGRQDGGVSADAVGTILTWLQEKAGNVFVVATANDVNALPPEMLRKGRFDEIFWVDLPTTPEREAILAATLRQHNRNPEDFDLTAVATATAEFSGAEIAELVPSSLFTAFADGKRQPTTDDLLKAADKTVPLAASASDKIDNLRAWSDGRTRKASLPEPTVTVSDRGAGIGSVLEVDEDPN